MEKDQRDLLLEFNEQSVRYLVVGGYALGRYTEPRVTKDLDVFIDISEMNAEKVFAALSKFGAPLQGLTPADFQDPYAGFQFGTSPSQIDILLAISAVSFDEGWKDSVPGTTAEGIEVRYLSIEHMIRNKLAAGHLRDLADAEALQRALADNQPEQGDGSP